MINPFKQLSEEDKTREREKKIMHNQISDKAYDITKKIVKRQLTGTDIDELEELYKKYFKKYPDAKSEKNSKDRIRKLRGFL